MGLGIKNKFMHTVAHFINWLKNSVFRPNLYNLNTSERIGAVYRHPLDMCETDRIMLYSLIRGIRPENVLEIGARWGGSARIITNAMEDNGIGKLVSIDPEPKKFRVKPKELHGRHELVEGYSPQITPEAVAKLDGDIEFVFIDALHIYDAVLADFEGVIPYLNDGAHVLFHDAFHQGISAAISKVLSQHSKFVDCGFITRNPILGYPVSYQGLRLVRYGTQDDDTIIKQAYVSRDQETPEFAPKYWNYDEYAIKMGIVKPLEPPRQKK